MSNLFIGKFKHGDQLEKNYYRVDADYRKAHGYSHFGGIKPGDYVLPVKNAEVKKLYILEEFSEQEAYTDAIFSVVKEYEPSLTLSGNITVCRHFIPDLNLLNKAIKSTKGVGFIPLFLEADSPDIDKIDFHQAKRRFFVCLEEKSQELLSKNFFRDSDICVTVSDRGDHSIIDILEFKRQDFVQNNSLWELYWERTRQGEEKYSLQQLLDFASEHKDNAPNKHRYLMAVLEELATDGIFTADNPVSLYDNLIVGRKKSFTPVKEIGPEIGPPESKERNSGVEPEDEELTDYEQYAKLLDFNPNLIPSGPPGTGKTYGAMRIVEAYEKISGRTCSYKQLALEGWAHFITFHQAFSYEEFVEGIRPEIDENNNISYPVKPGVLKEIADTCRLQEKKELHPEALANTSTANEVWEVSLGLKSQKHIFTTLRDKNVIAVRYNEDLDISQWDEERLAQAKLSHMLRVLFEKVNIGDLVIIANDLRTTHLIGVVTGDYFYSDEDSFGFPHRRQVQWLGDFETASADIFKTNQKKLMTKGAICKSNLSITDALSQLSKKEKSHVIKPHYLIIDEINRGNIASIFGELITLIEKDKREDHFCNLPYSKKLFSLPKNLYLIGTMNTTDRSIALFDMALRRRFAFVELIPDHSIVERKIPILNNHVKPAALLKELNRRLTAEIDRDHRIGHSYFMGDDLISKNDLFNVWYYKILPLLMEYFHNDIERVGKITGAKFIDKVNKEIIILNQKATENGISDFEAALIAIYESEA